MTKKIMLDPGHGGRDPGAVGHVTEKVVNLDVAQRTARRLKELYVCDVRLTRTDDRFLSLSDRCYMANNWRADLFFSIHSNAGGGAGYEDYIFSGSLPRKTIAIRDAIHPIVATVWTRNSRPNRGKKRANFFVLRETAMSAVLVENGFVDNATDAKLLQDGSFLAAIADANARAIGRAMGLKEIPQEQPGGDTGTIYRVQIGAFRSRDNALALAKEAEQAGFDAFIAS